MSVHPAACSQLGMAQHKQLSHTHCHLGSPHNAVHFPSYSWLLQYGLVRVGLYACAYDCHNKKFNSLRLIFHHNYRTECRLEATDIPQDAQDRLADIVKELKADPEREKLDVNYLHHGQVIAQAIEREKQATEAT